MSSKTTDHADELVTGLPGLMLPLIEKPTPEELERRQRLVERARQLREAIRAESGPLTVPTDDLKHESRMESEEDKD